MDSRTGVPMRILPSVILFGMLLVPAGVGASMREVPLPPAIDAELAYLLSFVGAGASAPTSFRPEQIENTLSFIGSSKTPGLLHHAKARDGARSAYFEIDVRRPLKEVLRLTYDDHIPAVVTAPSTVRTAAWKRIEPQSLRKLWDSLPKVSEPVSAVGTEHVVNTPDVTTGAYYEYDLDRTLLLLPFREQSLFISLSAQRGPSQVGQRGLIVGPDEHWNYLYTGRPGLGWVESYLYDSCSAVVYLGSAASHGTVRIGMFKWLRAGWARMNMVRSAHIDEGLQRFGRALKAILEHPRTADTEALIRTFAGLRGIPAQRLRELAGAYFKTVGARLPAKSGSEARQLLEDPGYLAGLGREELLALVSLERLKALLGKPHSLDSKVLATISEVSR